MQGIQDLFSAAPQIAWSIVGLLLALSVIALNWLKVKWWWHNTWYSFPIIGKIKRLSNDINKDPTDPTWFKAEKTLCRDYKSFILLKDEYDFNEKTTYLTKAGDIGRKTTPPLIWVLTVALVIVEAQGFTYVLAGYTVPGASENLQQTVSTGIALMLSTILVAFTHFAGQELYKSGKIKNARQEWVENGRKGKTTTGTVALAKPQSIDDAEPGYVQLMNRVGTKPTYYATWGTIIFVAVVAIFATYVRGQVLEKQLQQQITGQSGKTSSHTNQTGDALNLSLNKADKVGLILPAADAAANRQAEQQAINDEVSIDRHGGWGTFIVLAFIFVFLQILGVFFGFRWGFAGHQSEAAYKAIGFGRYSSYADVRERYKEIADIAQAKMENLQQEMMLKNAIFGNDGQEAKQTFYAFMDAERTREAVDRQIERERYDKENAPRTEKSATQNNSFSGNSENRSAPTPITPPAANSLSLSDILKQLQILGDNKEAKRSFINTLPVAMQADVKQALKAQKEESIRLAKQRDSELDDLL